MPTGELAAFDRLYLDHGTTSAVDTAVAILAGSCVGGGTVVNWTTCIAPPTGLREEWAREHGLDGFDGAVVDADIATLESELEVTAANPVGPKDAAILRGGAAAGIRNADCGACGSCGFGCRRGTKASGLRVHLARAYSAGARIVADAEVERVIIEGGRAVGVTATVRPAAIGGTGGAGATRSAPGGAIDAAPAGHADAAAATGFRVVVRARQVVVAAGALRTPAVLERSGIGHVEPRPGDDQARYTIESASGHPGLLALAFPWEGSDAFASLMDGSRFFAPLLAICRDLDGGRVSLTRTGRVRIDYRISPRDAVTMRAALATMARVARGAGATELVALGTPARWLDLSGVGPAGGEAGIAPSGSEPAFAAYLAELARWDPAPGRGMVFSAHQMGTVRAGADAASHPCDPDGRVRAAGTGSGGVVAGACTSPTRRSSRRRLASTR